MWSSPQCQESAYYGNNGPYSIVRQSVILLFALQKTPSKKLTNTLSLQQKLRDNSSITPVVRQHGPALRSWSCRQRVEEQGGVKRRRRRRRSREAHSSQGNRWWRILVPVLFMESGTVRSVQQFFLYIMYVCEYIFWREVGHFILLCKTHTLTCHYHKFHSTRLKLLQNDYTIFYSLSSLCQPHMNSVTFSPSVFPLSLKHFWHCASHQQVLVAWIPRECLGGKQRVRSSL